MRQECMSTLDSLKIPWSRKQLSVVTLAVVGFSVLILLVPWQWSLGLLSLVFFFGLILEAARDIRPLLGIMILCSILSMSIPSLTFPGVNVTKWGLLAAVLLFGLAMRPQSLRDIDFSSSSPELWLYLFLLWTILTSTFSLVPAHSIFRALSLLTLGFISFRIIPEYISTKGPYQKLVDSFLLIIFVVLFSGSILFFFNPAQVTHGYFILKRLRGIFYNPNSLGAICALAIPLILYRFSNSSAWGRRFLTFVLLLVLSNLFFSFSRAAWLGTAIGMLVYLFLKKRGLFYLFLTLSIFSLFFVLLSPTLQLFFRLAENPLSYRGDIWNIALAHWKMNFLKGMGFGVSLFLTSDPTLAWLYKIPKSLLGVRIGNIYIETLLETGVVGFFIFVGFIISAIKKGIILFRDPDLENYRPQFIVFLSLLGTMLAHGFFESLFLAAGNPTSIMLWILIGTTLRLPEKSFRN